MVYLLRWQNIGLVLTGVPGGIRMQNEDVLKPGSRFCLTPLGIARCPKLGGGAGGVVVSATPTKAGFFVLLDGAKTVRNFHRTYIKPVDREELANPVEAIAAQVHEPA
jgi:hypothetical protein